MKRIMKSALSYCHDLRLAIHSGIRIFAGMC
jgi:hypothetical protein